MRQLLVLFMFIVPGVCFGSERFQLQTELWTNYNGGAGGKLFTSYAYDASGNRISKRVFDGVDSSAALMSRELLTYDAGGRVSQDLLLSATGDTLSIVRNDYGVSDLVRASTLNKDGSTRFTDSLIYTGSRLAEQRRYNASGAMTFFHRYAYAQGLLLADSLYESDGSGGFAASQALLVEHNTDSTVSRETQMRKSGASWYPVGTTIMKYNQKHLLSATAYETDGVSGSMTDSLAYSYDANGNRIKEADFESDRTLVYDIVYTWLDKQPVGIAVKANDSRTLGQCRLRNGRICFGVPVSGSLVLCRMDGRRIFEKRLSGESFSSLPTGLSTGNYAAMVRGTVNQSLSIIISN